MDYKLQDLRSYRFVWKNKGMHPTMVDKDGYAVKVPIKDAIATPNAPAWLPKVLEDMVKEAQEPLLVGAKLLRRIDYHFGEFVSFPAVGALVAADIPEMGSYPEQQLTQGGATVTATIGKSGVAFGISEEMIRYSRYDLIRMHLDAAGRALARHKEQKIFNAIQSLGTTVFDNASPTSSAFGVTHGRDAEGTANGSIIMDDIFDAYGQVMTQGFIPDTLLMHPLCWSMFVKDPIMRAMALAGVANGAMFATYSGNPAARAPWDNSSQNGMGVSSGQNIVPGGNAGSQTASNVNQYSQVMNGAPNLPSYFPFPFRIVVSPLVDFDPASKLTNIMLFDSNELGALLVDEDVTTDEWTDQSVDLHKVKLRERYGIAILNEGLGVAVMKNIKVVPNEIVLPAQAHIDVSGGISNITATTAVV